MKIVFKSKPHMDKDLSSMYVIRNTRESKYLSFLNKGNQLNTKEIPIYDLQMGIFKSIAYPQSPERAEFRGKNLVHS